MARKAASYVGLKPASEKASAAARGSSRKSNTKPERLLRAALRRLGIRPSTTRRALPGKPDFVFVRKRVVVFVDGDYWHGRRWAVRKQKLAGGSNSAYWIAKIEGNRRRDRLTSRALRAGGWLVIREWETDVLQHPDTAACRIARTLSAADSKKGRHA